MRRARCLTGALLSLTALHLSAAAPLAPEVRPLVGRHLGKHIPGQPRVFESYQELLAGKLCDALVISTPNFSHIAVLPPRAPQAMSLVW